MQSHAHVVIIGAGIVGCSLAYHLARLGWRDICVLEQGPLFATGGSTSHAPGLVFQTNTSQTMCLLAQETVRLYGALGSATQSAFLPVGSLEVAGSPERWHDLKRRVGYARSWGLEAQLVSAAEAGALLPLLDAQQIHGAYLVPSDGIAKAVRACESLAEHAERTGAAQFYAHTPVTGIELANGRVQAVETPAGRIVAEHVVICAGIWGPRVGRLAGVRIPLTPVQHQYVRTTPLATLAGETREAVHPIVRHQDKALYFRQHADRYGIGSYQHAPLLVAPDAIRPHPNQFATQRADTPKPFFATEATETTEKQKNDGTAGVNAMPSVLPFTPQHFTQAWADAQTLLPALAQTDRTEAINGMFSFTPDGLPLIGESPAVRGLWVGEAVWVTHGGGVGKALAEWMVSGAPELDLRECDLNRFEAHAFSPAYVRARGAQQYREVYDILHPLQQMEQPRPLRTSPFYEQQQSLGAVFFEGRGWERAQWYAGPDERRKTKDESDDRPPTADDGRHGSGPDESRKTKNESDDRPPTADDGRHGSGPDESRKTKDEANDEQFRPSSTVHHPSSIVLDRSAWAAQHWSPAAIDEHLATRERVALYDMTPLTRLELSGPGALALLQQLTTGQMDKPVGSVVYTLLCDARGGVRSDITVARVAEECFQIGCNGLSDLAWIAKQLPPDGSAQLRDITPGSCGVGVWGPLARTLMQSLGDDDWSNEAFPYFSARQVFVGEVPCLALRVSYVGELGWELYTGADYGRRLWQLLWQAGQPLGIVAGGRAAFDSLRIEKGYRLWGVDLHSGHNPYEAGLDFAVKLRKGAFVGHAALAQIKREGVSRRLCCLTLEDPSAVMLGKEPLLGDDGRVLGYVTSAAYGPSVGQSIVYGYLPLAHSAEGTRVWVEYFGERYAATVRREPLYDPAGARLRV